MSTNLDEEIINENLHDLIEDGKKFRESLNAEKDPNAVDYDAILATGINISKEDIDKAISDAILSYEEKRKQKEYINIAIPTFGKLLSDGKKAYASTKSKIGDMSKKGVAKVKTNFSDSTKKINDKIANNLVKIGDAVKSFSESFSSNEKNEVNEDIQISIDDYLKTIIESEKVAVVEELPVVTNTEDVVVTNDDSIVETIQSIEEEPKAIVDGHPDGVVPAINEISKEKKISAKAKLIAGAIIPKGISDIVANFAKHSKENKITEIAKDKKLSFKEFFYNVSNNVLSNIEQIVVRERQKIAEYKEMLNKAKEESKMTKKSEEIVIDNSQLNENMVFDGFDRDKIVENLMPQPKSDEQPLVIEQPVINEVPNFRGLVAQYDVNLIRINVEDQGRTR